VLDELPSLEIAATAVAVVLVLRALRLSGAALVSRRDRVESARARDLIGLAILAGAIVYAFRIERATTWFLGAVGVAIAAQLVGFYLRAKSQVPTSTNGAVADGPELEVEEEELHGCPHCGHGTLIELTDPSQLMKGLHTLTPVVAVVCPSCGAISGHVEDPAQIPIGAEHGTTLQRSQSTEDQEALEDPAEHDG